jgi:hypothetical protein
MASARGAGNLGRQALIDALKSNVDAVRNLNTSYVKLGAQLGGFFNPLQVMTEAFQRQEKFQLKALAAGTTANQFIDANTRAVKGLQSSTLALREFMLTGFTQGLRDVSDSTMLLADEMIMTGQNTDALVTSLGFVRFATGNSVMATAKLSDSILKSVEDNGITSEKLVESLNSLRGVMTNVSIFGDRAVGTFAELGTALTGRLQGVQGSQDAITGILNLLSDPLQIAAQELLGLRGLSNSLIEGRISQDQAMSQIAQAARALQLDSGDPLVTAARRAALGGPLVNSLNLLGKGIENFEGLSEAERKQREDNFKTMRNFEQRKMDFFSKLAPAIHESIVNYLPVIAMTQAGFGAIQAGRDLRFAAGGRVRAAGGVVDPTSRFMNMAATGMKRLGLALPLIGIGYELYNVVKGIFKNSEAPAELAKQQLRANQANANSLATIGTVVQQLLSQYGVGNDGAMLNRTMQTVALRMEEVRDTLRDTPLTPQT